MKKVILLFSYIEKVNGYSILHIPFKRGFDIFFSLAALFLLSPIYAVLALGIKMTSSGPVIYGHERIGRGGKPFKCYKFRTMYPDADERLETILKRDPALKKEWEATFKLKNDPRITPIGKFLRKTSLDELPQFWNVLKGDLSVVGPRAVVQKELETYFKDKAETILSIRPGVTGLWQTSGRNNTTYAERVALDVTYVKNLSLKNDLKLILKTVKEMIASKGAF